MLRIVMRSYDRMIQTLSGPIVEGFMLLSVRVALAGVFWRSGRTKVEEGSWLTISDITYDLFRDDYSNVPIPPDFAAVVATLSEHLFPILLILGLFTRLSALALLGMTMVIQFYVFPDAWWQMHALWVALGATLIVRGGGFISLDPQLVKWARR